MTDFDTELSNLKNRYPEHFYKWLRRVRAEAVADFANLFLDTTEKEMALALVEEELT